MKSTMKSAFAFIAVALMIMVAVVPMVSVFTEENGTDATTATPGVVYADDMKATYYVYDSVTKTFNNDVGDLVYRAQKLPASLDPAEWVRHDTPGYVWYNVNEKSENYGKMLRYSMTGLSDEEIFNLLSATDGAYGSGSSWATTTHGFIQVTWTQLADADNVQIAVYKGAGTTALASPSLGGYTLERAGAYFANGVESVGYILFGASASGVIDIAGVPHGAYAIELIAEGKVQDSDAISIADQVAMASGDVKNKNDAVITGAKVSYTITDKDGKTTTGTVTTLTSEEAGKMNTYYNVSVFIAGHYYIMTEPGVVVKITDVSATGYTFTTKTYTTSTIAVTTADADKLKVNETVPTFTAEQYCVAITVKSNTGEYAIAGATIQATIYLQKQNATETSKYDIATSMTGATVTQPTYISNTTNASGIAYVTYKDPVITGSGITAYLYIKASGTSNFTFETKDVSTGTAVATAISSQITGLGAAKVISITTGSAVAAQTLNSKESVSSFTVKDDTNTNAIAGVSANATWYYQKEESSKIADLKTTAPTGVTAGTAKVLGTSSAKASDKGTIYIAYIDPTDSSTASGYTFNLYISLNAVSPFTFDTATIKTAAGSDLIATQASGHTGCMVATTGASLTPVLESKESTYTISGTITTTSNVTEDVALSVTGSSVDKSATAKFTNSTSATYSFVVLKGDSPTITFACDGYTFDNNGITIHTVSSAVTAPTVAMSEIVKPAAEYITSAVIDASKTANTYTVTLDSAPTAAVAVEYTYKIGDKSYATTVKSNGTSVSLGIALFDDAISSISVDVPGYATKAFVGTGANAYKLTSTNMIVFSDSGSTPTLNNVVAGAKIVAYLGTKEYTSFTSDENGLVTAEISSQFTYKYNDLVISISDVAGTKWGVSKGFNVSGFAPTPATVYNLTLSISYVAASSLKNVAEATDLSIDIQKVAITSGDSKTFVAPEIEGFKFAGWVYNGTATEDKTITVSAGTLTDYGTANLIAVYSAENVSESQKIDSTTLVIGIAAVIIALIAVVYAVIQSRK